jgi:hypothetical protein
MLLSRVRFVLLPQLLKNKDPLLRDTHRWFKEFFKKEMLKVTTWIVY